MEQLQSVALSGALGSVMRTAPQWQEPRSDWSVFSLAIDLLRAFLCCLTSELRGCRRQSRLNEMLGLSGTWHHLGHNPMVLPQLANALEPVMLKHSQPPVIEKRG